MGAKSKDKAIDPMMIIPLLFGTTRAKAAEIKNKIEKLTINDIISRTDILYESI